MIKKIFNDFKTFFINVFIIKGKIKKIMKKYPLLTFKCAAFLIKARKDKTVLVEKNDRSVGASSAIYYDIINNISKNKQYLSLLITHNNNSKKYHINEIAKLLVKCGFKPIVRMGNCIIVENAGGNHIIKFMTYHNIVEGKSFSFDYSNYNIYCDDMSLINEYDISDVIRELIYIHRYSNIKIINKLFIVLDKEEITINNKIINHINGFLKPKKYCL